MVTLILFSLIAGAFYRLGGMGDEGRKQFPEAPKWLFDSKARDVGVPLVATAYMVLNHGFHWSYVLCFGLLFGALTTYWKKKGTDAMWYNWLFVGLGYSFAMLPYALEVHHLVGFVVRTLVLTAWTVGWSLVMGDDDLEEFGRGFGIVASLPLLG